MRLGLVDCLMTEGQTQELREIKGFEFGGEYGRKTET